MKMMLATAAAALFLGIAGGARADDWRVVSASRDEVLAIDAATIQQSGGRIYYWSLNLFRLNQSDGVAYYMNYSAIDCQNRTIELFSELSYSESRQLIDNQTFSGAFAIAPSSVGATIHRTLCQGQWEWTAGGLTSVSQVLTELRPAMERMPVR